AANSERDRDTAGRLGSVLRGIGTARPRERPGRSLLLGGTPVLRLRTWQRALLSVPRRRLDGALPPAPRAGEGVRDPQPRAADAVFRRADRLRCDAAGAECRAHLRP